MNAKSIDSLGLLLLFPQNIERYKCLANWISVVAWRIVHTPKIPLLIVYHLMCLC